MAVKYEFTIQPETGVFGMWQTADGFKCYTDNRSQAVRFYKRHLEKRGGKK